jgi:tetratricopeptide (TPR) repeat protein
MRNTAIYNIVDAFRADAAASGARREAAVDCRWLILGSGLQNSLSIPLDDRESFLESIIQSVEGISTSESPHRRSSSVSERLASIASAVAEEAERKSSYLVATAILEMAGLLLPPSERVLFGRLLAQRGRILRKLGDFEGALEVFADVAKLAEKQSSDELVARALIGRACVALERGNHPEARAAFERVLEIPDVSPSIAPLHVLAHQGLLMSAGLARDFDRALSHGIQAFHAAPPGSELRTEILVSLASLCQDAGQYEAALNGHLSSAALTTSDSVRLTALGGAAVSAARLGRRAIVDRVVSAGIRLTSGGGNAYATADMERAFAEAYIRFGDTRQAERFFESATRRAQSGEFYEIQHELESLAAQRSVALEPSNIVLSAEALQAVSDLEVGNPEEWIDLVLPMAGRNDIATQ